MFFINEKVSFKHTVTMKNAMFRLLPDGNVIYSVKDPILKTDDILFMIIFMIMFIIMYTIMVYTIMVTSGINTMCLIT